MSVEYDNYIREHRDNLKRGLEWLKEWHQEHPGFDEAITEALLIADSHDESKYSKEEYDAYDTYFYGGERTPEVQEAFDRAWLHHQHVNPHHWQHWVLVNDDPEEGTRALEMSLPYIFEMIADWWTFSWRAGNLMEIFPWYMAHRTHIILHPNTRILVEMILTDMHDTLVRQMVIESSLRQIKQPEESKVIFDLTLAHSDDKEAEEDKNKFGVPELKKYPMPDAKHVRSAIRFFNYIDPKHEKELADAILERMKEYGMSFDDFGVGDENRFKQYIPKEKTEE